MILSLPVGSRVRALIGSHDAIQGVVSSGSGGICSGQLIGHDVELVETEPSAEEPRAAVRVATRACHRRSWSGLRGECDVGPDLIAATAHGGATVNDAAVTGRHTVCNVGPLSSIVCRV